MRGFLASTAVLGVIAVGGVPALGLVMTGEETTPSDERTATAPKSDRQGPPPWARGRGGAEGADDKVGPDQGPPAWARGGADGKQRGAPPGWARNHGGATPHGWAVREWAHCLADASKGLEAGQRPDPAACGEKPVSPGQAKSDKAKPQKAKPEKAKQPKAGRPG
jgi:hypothetical protein